MDRLSLALISLTIFVATLAIIVRLMVGKLSPKVLDDAPNNDPDRHVLTDQELRFAEQLQIDATWRPLAGSRPNRFGVVDHGGGDGR